MKRRLSIGILVGMGMLILTTGFQNCAQKLPDNSQDSSSSTGSSLGPKIFVGSASQTADLATVGATWVDVSGASITFTLPSAMTLDMQANGSMTVGAGATSLNGHCGLRFVVDGVPYGNITWGDVLVGLNAVTANTGYWSPWTISRHLPVPAGAHTVKLQQTGWSTMDSACKSYASEHSRANLSVDAH